MTAFKRIHFLSFLFGAISLLFLACSAQQGALPQVSLPPPANDCGTGGGCIIGSAPSTSGFVSVTGSAGAVPGGAVVEAEIPTSSSSWDQLLNSLCSSAYALDCSSDLDLCGTQVAGEGCHVIAGGDGSFLLQIEAELGDTIRLIYLNPEDCRESQAFELEVTNDFVSLNLEGKVMTDNSLDTAHIFGLSPDGTNQVISVGVPLEISPNSANDVNIEGSPASIDYLPTTNDLVLVTLDAAGLFDLDADTTDVASLNLDITEGGLLAHKGVVDKNFTYPDLFATEAVDPKFACLIDATPLTLQTVDRIFFSRQITPETNTYPIALFDGFVDPMGSSYMARAISYGFERTELEGAILEAVLDIFISLQGTQAFFLGQFDVAGITRFYLVGIPLDGSPLCSGVAASTVTLIPLPEEMVAPGKGLFFGSYPDFAGEADGILLIPDKALNTVFAISLKSGAVATVIDDLTVTPLDTSRLGGLFEIMPAAFPDTYPLNFFGIGDSMLFPAILELTSPLADVLEATEIENNEIIGFTPIDLELFTTTDFNALNDPSLFDGSFLILSVGFPDDGMSLLREMNLGDL